MEFLHPLFNCGSKWSPILPEYRKVQFLAPLLEDDISMQAGSENVRPLIASGHHSRRTGDTAATRGAAINSGNKAVVVIHAVRDALEKQGVPKDSIIVTLGLIALAI